jgi:hypothetical protein
LDPAATGGDLRRSRDRVVRRRDAYLRPILQPNPRITLRTEYEPLLGRIRASIDTSRLWIYFPADLENRFIGHMLQYLLAPTPTVVERSADFLQGDDAASIAAAWRRFDYVWIASPLTPEGAAGLARFSAARHRRAYTACGHRWAATSRSSPSARNTTWNAPHWPNLIEMAPIVGFPTTPFDVSGNERASLANRAGCRARRISNRWFLTSSERRRQAVSLADWETEARVVSV